MKKALIINGHQFFEHLSPGHLNTALVNVMAEELGRQGYQVRHTEIEKGYDIAAEVDHHVWADLIVLQTPVFWFGTPWLYKKYVDEVFTAGMFQQQFLVDDGRSRQDPGKQYGTGGKMQGKKYLLSLTWNAPGEAFGDDNQYLFSGKTVDDVFVNNTANYKFCGADILPSFSAFDVMKAPDAVGDMARLREHLARYAV